MKGQGMLTGSQGLGTANRATRTDGLLYRVAVLGLLFVPLVMCWRPWQPLFFVHDDWTLLAQMARVPFWEYVNSSKNEHWFPLFKVIFYGLVTWAGERYHLLVLVNCLLTGVNSVLVQRFFRLHLPTGTALALGFLYAASAGHAPTIWTVSYLQFILSLTFLLTALLLTVRYVWQPSGAVLAGVGLASFLSLLCNNFPLLALAALPLYALLLGEGESRQRGRNLVLVVGGVYLFFAAGYVVFAGIGAAAFNNPELLSRLPTPGYMAHVLAAAVLSPFCYLFWGHFHFRLGVYVLAGLLLGLSLAAILRWGRSPERRLAAFALALNLLPFILVSLARYQKAVSQAFVPRYATFTLIGALCLLGVAANIMRRRFALRRWPNIILILLIVRSLAGQLMGLHQWQQDHLKWGIEARALYHQAQEGKASTSLPPENELIRRPWLDEHTPLTWSQFQAIGRFLNRDAGK